MERENSRDLHTILILDKNAQQFPWESFPILRGEAVSRLPSIAFLRERIKKGKSVVEDSMKSKDDMHKNKFIIDPKKTFYILNPSQDLVNTQKEFESWLLR